MCKLSQDSRFRLILCDTSTKFPFHASSSITIMWRQYQSPRNSLLPKSHSQWSWEDVFTIGWHCWELGKLGDKHHRDQTRVQSCALRCNHKEIHASARDHELLALTILMKSGLREAPPTRNPSTSDWAASVVQLAAFTEPSGGEEGRCAWVGGEVAWVRVCMRGGGGMSEGWSVEVRKVGRVMRGRGMHGWEWEYLLCRQLILVGNINSMQHNILSL